MMIFASSHILLLILFVVEAGQSLALNWICVILAYWQLQRLSVIF
jgi:cytochrome oxidase assembly protein ShyY1